MKAFTSLRNSSSSLDSFGSNFSLANEKYVEMLKNLSDADTRAFATVDRTVAVLSNTKNQPNCRNTFSRSVAIIYAGWLSMTSALAPVDNTTEIPESSQQNDNLITTSQDYQLYCQ